MTPSWIGDERQSGVCEDTCQDILMCHLSSVLHVPRSFAFLMCEICPPQNHDIKLNRYFYTSLYQQARGVAGRRYLLFLLKISTKPPVGLRVGEATKPADEEF